MRSVLFVCTANICRSPMAEGVLHRLLEQRQLEPKIAIDSVGTHDYHAGEPPFPKAAAAAKRRGYEIGHLVARRITPEDLDKFDMILAMDRANIAHLRTVVPTRCKQKIELLLEYGDKHHGKDVPDPYGSDDKAYERALDMIEDGCAGLVEYLARVHEKSRRR